MANIPKRDGAINILAQALEAALIAKGITYTDAQLIAKLSALLQTALT